MNIYKKINYFYCGTTYLVRNAPLGTKWPKVSQEFLSATLIHKKCGSTWRQVAPH